MKKNLMTVMLASAAMFLGATAQAGKMLWLNLLRGN